MKFRLFGKNGNDPGSSKEKERQTLSFDKDFLDPGVFRHHALRILCGAFMDRHSDCRSPHPFCGPGHRGSGDVVNLMIAHAMPETSGETRDEVIGIYLCRASATSLEGIKVDDYLNLSTRLEHADSAPVRKLLSVPPADGKFSVLCGPLLDPVKGEFMKGNIDPDNVRTYICDPEPPHCRWQYWDTELTADLAWEGRLAPTYHCIQARGEWWVFEIDYEHGEARIAAVTELADNPEHNYGIHNGRLGLGDMIEVDPRTELGLTLWENKHAYQGKVIYDPPLPDLLENVWLTEDGLTLRL